MPSLNDWKGMGYTTRDIELKYTQSGTALCDVGLAITRKFKAESGEKKEETTFVEITFFGRHAEILAEYVKKGDPLFVQGRLYLDTWQDKQTNQPRSRLKVIGEGLQLLTKPQKADNGTPAKGSRPAPAPQGPPLPDDEEPSHIPFYCSSVK
jgi:single-strand DNA-binding protein